MKKFLENSFLTERPGHTQAPPLLPTGGARPPVIASQANEWSLDPPLLRLSGSPQDIWRNRDADGNGFNIRLETVRLDGSIALCVATEKTK
jgi:hypothetical protein